jgi:hypothetical protein
MPTATYTKCTAAIEPLLEGINVGSDSWKVALSNASAVAKTSFVAGTDDLATGNGYTAGGNACTPITTAGQTAGTYTLTLPNPAVWTASGAVGPFRYAILWDTTTSTPVAEWDYGVGGVTLASGDTFTFAFSGNVFTAT